MSHTITNRTVTNRRLTLAAFTLGLMATIACGDAGSELSPVAVHRDTPTCDNNSDCRPGTHCGAEAVCVASCVLGAGDCAAGESCGDDGRCAPMDTLGDPWVNECAIIDATLEPVTPTVVLLIDQSGSMTSGYPGGTRWSVLEEALMDIDAGVVSNLDQEVRFGMALYTSHGGFSGGTCPMLAEVDVALDNFAAMAPLYAAAAPDGDTPTGESLRAVADKLAALDVDGPKAIIIATDGEPDTCADPNPTTPSGRAAARDVALAAASDAHADGIDTYVLAVGSDVGATHLQDMANAGAGLPIGGPDNATFFRPDSKQDLVAAFNSIIDEQRPCLFAIQSTNSVRGDFDPSLASYATVTLDGRQIDFEDPNGWRMSSNDHIELMGSSCQALKAGEHEVTASFVCEAPPGTAY